MDVGTLIRRARDQAGLSQRDLAAQSGTSQSQISNYESGKVSPSIETLERLVRACGFVLRVRLGIPEVTEEDAAMVDRNLERPIGERVHALRNVVRARNAAGRKAADRDG